MFNTLILLSGMALTLAGILLRVTFEYEHVFVNEKIYNITLMVLGLGITLILLGMLSIISLTQCGNSMMHALCIIALMVTTIILGSLGLWTYFAYNNQSLINEAKSQMNTTFIKYEELYPEKAETIEINLLQTRFKCCGLRSYTDYKLTDPVSLAAISKYELIISGDQISYDLPDTCCVKIAHNCGKDFRAKSSINVNGCYEPFINFLSRRILIISSISTGIACLNILSFLYLLLVCAILKGDYDIFYLWDGYDVPDDLNIEKTDRKMVELDPLEW